MKTAITKGRIFNSETGWTECENILIENDRIFAIDGCLETFSADEVIVADNQWIIPGLIDLNVSLREPGFPEKGSIASETKAAVAGGVTTLCCPPDTLPVNDSKAVSNLIEEQASRYGHCRVLPLGAVTKGLKGESLSEYSALKKAGCIALSSAFNPFKNLSVAKRCFEYAKTHGLSVFVNPLEPSLHKGVVHAGQISTTIGLQGIPSVAETIAVAQLIQLAHTTGAHLHLSQISAAESVNLVADAKTRDIPVTADVSIHNLLYTDRDTLNFNSLFHCQPPLRAESDRQALISGVTNGTIDAITSAHQPHEAAAKLMPFAETEPGISGVELILTLAVQLHDQDDLPLDTFIRAMTDGAARVLRRPSPSLVPGETADLCIYDPSHRWLCTPETLVSTGSNTPLLNQELSGRVRSTLVAGRTVYRLVE